jgi:CspA family cold shock protein
MTSRGVVKFFNAEKGWGAISSGDLPPGRDAWVHFSAIEAPQGQYQELSPGEDVEFDWIATRQDSFDFRAERVWRRPEAPK